MMRLASLLPLPLLVAACSTTINETTGSFTSDRGRTYPTITREFQQDNGATYSRTTIIVGARRVSCATGDARDCNQALYEVFDRERD